MSDLSDAARAHYKAIGLIERIQAALASVVPEGEPLNVAQLAPLDQFHTRGLAATAELAGSTRLDATSRVLDLGCGVGGPARYIAFTFGCRVTGVDLSASFVEAAAYLARRAGLADNVSFEIGDALNLPFQTNAFDAVLLQHVMMNIADRARLYAGIRKVLATDGRLAIYDIVRRADEVIYPTPWARDAAASFLLSEDETRRQLEDAGFTMILWSDDTPAALEWLKTISAAPPEGALNLGVVMGPDFPIATGNLARNIREGRVGVLSAVLSLNE